MQQHERPQDAIRRTLQRWNSSRSQSRGTPASGGSFRSPNRANQRPASTRTLQSSPTKLRLKLFSSPAGHSHSKGRSKKTRDVDPALDITLQGKHHDSADSLAYSIESNHWFWKFDAETATAPTTPSKAKVSASHRNLIAAEPIRHTLPRWTSLDNVAASPDAFASPRTPVRTVPWKARVLDNLDDIRQSYHEPEEGDVENVMGPDHTGNSSSPRRSPWSTSRAITKGVAHHSVCSTATVTSASSVSSCQASTGGSSMHSKRDRRMIPVGDSLLSSPAMLASLDRPTTLIEDVAWTPPSSPIKQVTQHVDHGLKDTRLEESQTSATTASTVTTRLSRSDSADSNSLDFFFLEPDVVMESSNHDETEYVLFDAATSSRDLCHDESSDQINCSEHNVYNGSSRRIMGVDTMDDSDDDTNCTEDTDDLYLEIVPRTLPTTRSFRHKKVTFGSVTERNNQSCPVVSYETRRDDTRSDGKPKRAMMTAAGAIVIHVEKCRVRRLRRQQGRPVTTTALGESVLLEV